jgi:site-specific recombinase XerD
MNNVITPKGRYCHSSSVIPPIINDHSETAARYFLEFFAAQIRNSHTRAAYMRAAWKLCDWLKENKINELCQVKPVHIALWVETRMKTAASQTIKQELAGIRQLFNWLVIKQAIPSNPADAVRGPRYSTKKGKTPVLSVEETRMLIQSIPTTTIGGLRDRALLAIMIYTFARISAAIKMNVKDVYTMKGSTWVRLHEKGGKNHEMPCHPNLQKYLEEYITTANIKEKRGSPLFRTMNRQRNLSQNRLNRTEAWHMVRRRARQSGINTDVCNHTFRGTGITSYLQNPNARLELAQQMANHADPKTTKIYDRRSDGVSLNEIKLIGI